MTDLLDFALQPHGGVENWKNVTESTFESISLLWQTQAPDRAG
jgi:hypothetical protein